MRKKIGNIEVIITPEILSKLRDRAGEYEKFGSYAKLAESIRTEFPMMAVRTLAAYLTAVRKASNLALQFAIEGKISFGVLLEIAQSAMDHASQDIVVMHVVNIPARKAYGRLERAGASNISHVKRILMRGYGDRKGPGKVSLADALAIAWGEVPAHSRAEDVKKATRDFGGILGDLLDASNTFMARLDEAMELMPVSILDTDENRMELFHKLTLFANTLENSHRFVVERRGKFLAATRAHIVTEAAMDQRRKEEGGL